MVEVKVCMIDECTPGMMKQVAANGKTLLLANVNGQFYCCENSCTHRGGPLAEGELQGAIVTCPWHGAQFDVTKGKFLTRLLLRILEVIRSQ